MVSGSLKLTFKPVNSLNGFYSSLAFGSVTSFFGIKVCVFVFFSKTTRWICAKVFFRIYEKTLVHYNLH